MAKWLAVDPGEDTGWSLWDDDTLLDAGTAKLWEFGEAVWDAMFGDPDENELVGDELTLKLVGITGIVCENFRIYPWEAKKGSLNWDEVRTARLIGALFLIAKKAGLWWKTQDAKIKERAVAAGAEAFFLSPRHENRHANDSIMHGVYYRAIVRGVEGADEQAPSSGDDSDQGGTP